ncbi:hypothetical protein VTN77DRAFT_1914 [Rasamsonia byssochlamydoides]|uniref:uncharacterized protein n=1 Tax=Rasamsonia byssochlamydoides TaxID=89139 RepID=UPI003743B1D0
MATGNSQHQSTNSALQSFSSRNAQTSSQTEPAPPTPPTKRDLASWWKQFKRNTKKEEENKGQQKGGIFGVPLNVSIKYANVAISLTNDKGESFIYGYVPIVVAKCGVFLKEQATDIEGIFRLSGSARRIKELQEIFDSPERYGKGLDWSGYTVHDAANILRRYLNQLPEPIVPLEFYERFREPLRNHQAQAVGDMEAAHKDSGDFDYDKAVATYQQLIRELPPLNKQLLLYILDLLAVFASKSEKNRMTSANLSAIFQPGLLSHPSHDMAPEEYKLSQDVLIFLIENQDHFLFGMNGTAADPQTVEELQTNNVPETPTPRLRRSASNASAGADSLRKYEIRRNVSVSSKGSRNSGNAQSPGTPTSITGVHRSNTVPSKKSPGLASSRLGRSGEPATPTPTSASLAPPPQTYGRSRSSSRAPSAHGPRLQNTSEPSTADQVQGQTPEQSNLLGPLPTGISTPPAITPTRERKLSSFFTKSPPTEHKEVRQPNRLRKKRIPGSSNESAQSSSQSLSTAPADPPAVAATSQMPVPTPVSSNDSASSYPNREGHVVPPPAPDGGGGHHHQASESTLRPSRSRTPSLHSRSSFTDHSDLQDDQVDEAPRVDKKENRRSWRFYTASTQDSDLARSTSNLKDSSQSSEPEKRSLFDKFKFKVAHMKEGPKDERERAKSPPQSDTELSVTSSQNLSQIIRDSKNGQRGSTERSRESLDARESLSHLSASSPPVILEESPLLAAVTAAAEGTTAPEQTTTPAPESEAEVVTLSSETKVDEAHAPVEDKSQELQGVPNSGDPAASTEPEPVSTEPEGIEKN